MANWKSVALQVPGKDLLQPIDSMLETLLVFLEVIKSILQLIEMFLVDFGNPLRAIVQALLSLVTSLFNSLKQTGLFAWFDVPDPSVDPNFYRNTGGFQAFNQRFIGGLFDTKDPNRPQPVAGISQSGFVMLVVDAEDIYTLLRQLNVLMRFFSRELIKPMYAAPTNAKVVVVGSKGDPILRLKQMFEESVYGGLAVEWGPSDSAKQPDPGFSDMASQVGATFIPQKFLIEKTTTQHGTPMVVSVPTNFEDKAGDILSRPAQVVDEYGDPVRICDEYIVIDSTSFSGLLGQLGKYRFIDTDVQSDKTYYYRIRAFSGDLAVNGTSLTFPPPTKPDPNSQEIVSRWPAVDPSKPPVMGQPTNFIRGRVPTPVTFDVLGLLTATFEAAFSLGFHLPTPPGATFDPHTGQGINGTPNQDIGMGSLKNQAGSLSNFVPQTLSNVSPVGSSFPDVSWQNKLVKAQSARLAQTVGNALLENSTQLLNLRDMYNSLPRGLPNHKGYVTSSVTNIGQLVKALTTASSNYKTSFDQKLYDTASFAYTDPYVRLNVLAAVNYISSFTLGGNPPDWIQVSVLKDIIPWSGALLYQIMSVIEALLDAFKSALDEIKAFVDLLIKKIEVLERFIQFLVSILDFLLSLNVGFYTLNVTGVSGIEDWIQALQTAGGTPPPSGPGGYTGGVVFAYAAPNVAQLAAALNLIF